MKPFTFSDGTVVNIGDCISTPVKPVMQNPLHYPSPQQFSGFRFASHEALDKLNTHPLENSGKEWVDNDAPRQKAPSKMTDIDENWHVFGAGKISWYVYLPTYLPMFHVFSPLSSLSFLLSSYLFFSPLLPRLPSPLLHLDCTRYNVGQFLIEIRLQPWPLLWCCRPQGYGGPRADGVRRAVG